MSNDSESSASNRNSFILDSPSPSHSLAPSPPSLEHLLCNKMLDSHMYIRKLYKVKCSLLKEIFNNYGVPANIHKDMFDPIKLHHLDEFINHINSRR
jgi:hypothetical protein